MNITDYIKVELLVLVVVLYVIGMIIKSSKKIKDNYIPIILGLVGIVLATLYVFATSDISNASNIATAIFTGITQGILCAGLAVYCNQTGKQLIKLKDE